jgi:hypothetical protein
MKLNNLKKTPRKEVADTGDAFQTIDEKPVDQAEVNKQLLFQRLSQNKEFKAELVRINNDKKDIIYLRTKPDEFNKISEALINIGVKTLNDFNKIKPVAQLTFDNSSLHGKLGELKSSDDKITMSMEIERDDKDTDNTIKDEIDRQIDNQNNIGVPAFATVTLLPSTHPKNDGQIVLKRREVADLPKDLRNKSGMGHDGGTVDVATVATATDAQLPSELVALLPDNYAATIEGNTDEMKFVYAQFGDVVVKTVWNTTGGQLNVEMKERRLTDGLVLANSVSAGIAILGSNLIFAAKRTKTPPLAVFGRRIAAKHAEIQGGEVKYRDFSDLANFLMEIGGGTSTGFSRFIKPDIIEQADDLPELIAVNVRVKTQGRGTLTGEAKDINYENNILSFTIFDPETKYVEKLRPRDSSWGNGSRTTVGKVEFTVGMTAERAKLD